MITDNDVLELMDAHFKFGGRGNGEYDCYGLVEAALKRDGKIAPERVTPNTRLQMARMVSGDVENNWTEIEERPGAVVLLHFGSQLHMGYCLEDGYFLHASEIAKCIAREPLSEYRDYIVGFYEFTGTD